MSHDLAFFEYRAGISEAEIRAAYLACCESTKVDSGQECPVLSAFVRDLELRYPSLATLGPYQCGDSPWSSEFLRGPTYLIISMTYGRAPEVVEYLGELLQKHPLVVFDPQADQAFFGPNRLQPSNHEEGS